MVDWVEKFWYTVIMMDDMNKTKSETGQERRLYEERLHLTSQRSLLPAVEAPLLQVNSDGRLMILDATRQQPNQQPVNVASVRI